MNNQDSTKPMPWADGYYKHSGTNSMLNYVKGENVKKISSSGNSIPLQRDKTMSGTWTYGDFGVAHPKIIQEIGETNYNLEMSYMDGKWVTKAVLYPCGKKIYAIGMSGQVDILDWISEEELEAFQAAGDPADAPCSHYTPQPQYQGKLLWITGPPGAGKSTSAQMISKKAGYVYYEADAFLHQLNPYIPPDVDEPSIATFKQKNLKGVSQEVHDDVANGLKCFMKMIQGSEYDSKPIKVLLSAMCKNISAERRRLGGDWVVAFGVTSKEFRDHIRDELGSDLVFICLNLSKEEQEERVKARHSAYEKIGKMFTKAYDIWEPAEKDEPNTIEIILNDKMTREEVCQEILDKVEQIR